MDVRSRLHELSPTRHPVLDVLGDGSTKDWDTPELNKLRKLLRDDPHSLALWQSQDDMSPTTQDEQSSSEESDDSFYSLAEPESETEDLALWQSHMEDEAISGLDQVLHKVPLRTMQPKEHDSGSDSHGSFSSGQSESSHEDGPNTEVDTSDSESENADGGPDDSGDYEDALTAGITEEGGEILTKGQRRRLLNAAQQIADAAALEVSSRSATMTRTPKATPRSRWRILELFTWSCMLSMTATERGCWEAWEPISLESGWDVSTMAGQDKAMRYIQEVEPDLLMIAWPCGPWSPLQNISVRTEAQKLTLRRKRLQARRTVLSFTRRAALWQRHRGALVFGENPAGSKAWSTPEISEAFDGLEQVRFDQCQVGLKHPTNFMPMRKRTILAGESKALEELKGKLCPGDHEHHVIEGGYQTEQGIWASLSEYAGGYPKELCTAMLKGAETYPEDPILKKINLTIDPKKISILLKMVKLEASEINIMFNIILIMILINIDQY